MKKSLSVILCAVLMLTAIPFCTAGAADAKAAPGFSGSLELLPDGYQPTALELILADCAEVFTFSPESMDDVWAAVQNDLTGIVLVTGFGGFIYLPLLLMVPLLRLVIGIPKVIAANIRNSF